MATGRSRGRAAARRASGRRRGARHAADGDFRRRRLRHRLHPAAGRAEDARDRARLHRASCSRSGRDYLGYALSALVIGLYWVHHHFSGAIYRTTGHHFLLATLLFLARSASSPSRPAPSPSISRIPHARETGAIFYTCALAAIALAWLIKWRTGCVDRRRRRPARPGLCRPAHPQISVDHGADGRGGGAGLPALGGRPGAGGGGHPLLAARAGDSGLHRARRRRWKGRTYPGRAGPSPGVSGPAAGRSGRRGRMCAGGPIRSRLRSRRRKRARSRTKASKTSGISAHGGSPASQAGRDRPSSQPRPSNSGRGRRIGGRLFGKLAQAARDRRGERGILVGGAVPRSPLRSAGGNPPRSSGGRAPVGQLGMNRSNPQPHSASRSRGRSGIARIWAMHTEIPARDRFRADPNTAHSAAGGLAASGAPAGERGEQGERGGPHDLLTYPLPWQGRSPSRQ